MSRTLTDSAGRTITPAARGLAPAPGAGENERHSSPCVLFSWDDTAPAAPAARIQVSAKESYSANSVGVPLQPGCSFKFLEAL